MGGYRELLQRWERNLVELHEKYEILSFFTVTNILQLYRQMNDSRYKQVAHAFSFLFACKEETIDEMSHLIRMTTSVDITRLREVGV